MNQKKDSSDWWVKAIVALIFIAIVAVGSIISYFIAGQDIGCMFANDPALCAAVKGK